MQYTSSQVQLRRFVHVRTASTASSAPWRPAWRTPAAAICSAPPRRASSASSVGASRRCEEAGQRVCAQLPRPRQHGRRTLRRAAPLRRTPSPRSTRPPRPRACTARPRPRARVTTRAPVHTGTRADVQQQHAQMSARVRRTGVMQREGRGHAPCAACPASAAPARLHLRRRGTSAAATAAVTAAPRTAPRQPPMRCGTACAASVTLKRVWRESAAGREKARSAHPTSARKPADAEPPLANKPPRKATPCACVGSVGSQAGAPGAPSPVLARLRPAPEAMAAGCLRAVGARVVRMCARVLPRMSRPREA
jgi:hypothetical protein